MKKTLGSLEKLNVRALDGQGPAAELLEPPAP